MSKKEGGIFGEVVASDEVQSMPQVVEVRYSLMGEKVRAAKNIAFMANTYAEKIGIKGIKENVLFQSIFDQAIWSMFEPTQTIYVTLSNGKPWKISLAGMTLESFNEQVEAFKKTQEGAGKTGGAEPSKEGGKAHQEEEEEQGDAHLQEDLLPGSTGQNGKEETEMERLEREMLEGK